jgi:hypothetical protein
MDLKLTIILEANSCMQRIKDMIGLCQPTRASKCSILDLYYATVLIGDAGRIHTAVWQSWLEMVGNERKTDRIQPFSMIDIPALSLVSQ